MCAPNHLLATGMSILVRERVSVQESFIPSMCTLLLDVHMNVLHTHLFPPCMYILVGNGSLNLSEEQHPPEQESWSRTPVLAGGMHWGGSGKTVIDPGNSYVNSNSRYDIQSFLPSPKSIIHPLIY